VSRRLVLVFAPSTARTPTLSSTSSSRTFNSRSRCLGPAPSHCRPFRSSPPTAAHPHTQRAQTWDPRGIAELPLRERSQFPCRPHAMGTPHALRARPDAPRPLRPEALSRRCREPLQAERAVRSDLELDPKSDVDPVDDASAPGPQITTAGRCPAGRPRVVIVRVSPGVPPQQCKPVPTRPRTRQAFSVAAPAASPTLCASREPIQTNVRNQVVGRVRYWRNHPVQPARQPGSPREPGSRPRTATRRCRRRSRRAS
jgi:hypothetical protein